MKEFVDKIEALLQENEASASIIAAIVCLIFTIGLVLFVFSRSSNTIKKIFDQYIAIFGIIFSSIFILAFIADGFGGVGVFGCIVYALVSIGISIYIAKLEKKHFLGWLCLIINFPAYIIAIIASLLGFVTIEFSKVIPYSEKKYHVHSENYYDRDIIEDESGSFVTFVDHKDGTTYTGTNGVKYEEKD